MSSVVDASVTGDDGDGDRSGVFGRARIELDDVELRAASPGA